MQFLPKLVPFMPENCWKDVSSDIHSVDLPKSMAADF